MSSKPSNYVVNGRGVPWSGCSMCEGEGTVFAVYQCCMKFAPDGRCCGNPEEIEKGCPVCDGFGVVPLRLS